MSKVVRPIELPCERVFLEGPIMVNSILDIEAQTRVIFGPTIDMTRCSFDFDTVPLDTVNVTQQNQTQLQTPPKGCASQLIIGDGDNPFTNDELCELSSSK